ncbi:MAG: ABC transporter ATP-binding protein [Elusimicrobia bacterium]|nr:ABC transporter ATP-binding protein [Elusimicrobiota bacterium]
MIGLYVILALGLNVTLGFVGLFDLGYMAFYAIGAYSAAILSISGWNFWFSTLAAILISIIFRLLLGAPVLRLRGDYLAIVTLGFGEIVRLVLNNTDSLTNGPKGLPRVGEAFTPLMFFNFEFSENIHFYYLILAVVFLAVIVSKRLENSRIGRAWTAVREDEIAAELSGIPVTRVKMLAFATSALFAAIAGSIFVHWERFLTPESFTFWESVLVVSMIVLGGIGSISGVILGAVLISGIPQVLQAVLGGDLISYRYLIFGIALVVIIIFRPQGLIPSKRQELELEIEQFSSTV